jgi:HK97 gp10 family phage protein
MNFVNIKGGKELQEFLNTLPVKVEKNILRSALRAGAKVIAEEAKQNVPVKSGELRDSIVLSTDARKGKVTAKAKTSLWYAKFVEFGTAAHKINPKNGMSLLFGGRWVKSVDHPGSNAKPFLRPALDTKANEAINAVGVQIGKRLTKLGLNAPAMSAGSEE